MHLVNTLILTELNRASFKTNLDEPLLWKIDAEDENLSSWSTKLQDGDQDI